jgi:hypothetical protein
VLVGLVAGVGVRIGSGVPGVLGGGGIVCVWQRAVSPIKINIPEIEPALVFMALKI